MKYVIYGGLVLLAVWAVVLLVRRITAQVKGDCGSGCDGCNAHCDRRKTDEEDR